LLIRLDSNLKQVARKYRRFSRQVPFTAAKTINQLAIKGRVHEAEQMERDLDRPTSFTKGGGKGGFLRKAKGATKRSLTNIQEVKRIQASYLIWQIEGGIQTAINAPGNKQGSRILVPTDAQPRDGHGNVRNPAYRRVIASTKNSPQLWRKNQAGIFRQYKSRGDEFRFAFARSAKYQARYAFGAGYVRYIVKMRAFEKIFNREIKKSIATAK